MQPGQSGPAGGYAELKTIFDQAVDYLHGRTRSGRKYKQSEVDEWIASTVGQGSPIRTFKQLVNTIQGLDRAGAKPVDASDLGPLERGAIARTVRFGHSALPFTDEIAGALSWLGGNGYRAGRDENRQYLENADLSVNKGPLNPDIWGPPAGALATMGAGAAAAPAPSLVRAGATGAGYGLGYTVGDLPELNPEAVRENAVPLALNTALGGAMGVGGAVMGRRLTALRQPGPLKMSKVLEAAGGEQGLTRAVEGSGVQRPMLAELSETSFGRLSKELQRASQEAQTAATQRVAQELQTVQQAKQAVSQRYGILEAPIADPRAGEILAKPRVQRIVKTLMQDGVIQPGQVTGRVLEDVRQEMEAMARRAYTRGNGRVGKLYRGYARELQGIIDGSLEGMPEVRAAYAPLAQREARLNQLMRQLTRQARRSGIPVERGVTAKSEFMQDIGGEQWQREMRAARQMVDPLFTPGTAAEHLSRIRGGMPWYSHLGAAAQPGAAMVPQLTDPFFPLRQLPDSGQ